MRALQKHFDMCESSVSFDQSYLWSEICFLDFGFDLISCKDKLLLKCFNGKLCIWYTVSTFLDIHILFIKTTFSKYAKKYRSFTIILTDICHAQMMKSDLDCIRKNNNVSSILLCYCVKFPLSKIKIPESEICGSSLETLSGLETLSVTQTFWLRGRLQTLSLWRSDN